MWRWGLSCTYCFTNAIGLHVDHVILIQQNIGHDTDRHMNDLTHSDRSATTSTSNFHLNTLFPYEVRQLKNMFVLVHKRSSVGRFTVKVDIFALYIFSRNSRFLNIRENMYTSKITFILAYRANYT